MSEVEYLTALSLLHGNHAQAGALRTELYQRNGVSTGQIEAAIENAGRYRVLVPGLPAHVVPLRAGDQFEVGHRRFSVILGAGHSPAQVMLHDVRSNLLIVADQVLTRITPNVGILDRSPDDDTLSLFLTSLNALKSAVPNGGLVLPGHHLPFRTLHARIDELAAHHDARCKQIGAACEPRGRTIGDIVPILFPFELDAHQFWFAFSETAAHLNHLEREGRLEKRMAHGQIRWGSLCRPSHATE